VEVGMGTPQRVSSRWRWSWVNIYYCAHYHFIVMWQTAYF
jgi:hypothetical protein